MGAETCSVDTVEFPPGASLLLYTDGLTEARDSSGAFYDPADHLTGQCPRSPDELLTTLLEDVHQHTRKHATDDMALLALTHTPQTQSVT
ncbi:SpoIIE family protein phosphatase [Streptomyces fagopyri]